MNKSKASIPNEMWHKLSRYNFALSRFLGAESILRTIEFNVAQVKSITIESGGFDQADSVDNRFDPGDASNTFF